MAADIDSIAANTLSRTVLTPEQLKQEVAALGARWSVDGNDLKLELRDAPMAKYGAAAAHATELADKLDHPPRITLEPSGFDLRITTTDENAITVLDLVYAARLERWLRTNGW